MEREMGAEYDKLTQSLYAGILSPTDWNSALLQLRILLDSEQCTFLVHDKQFGIPIANEVANFDEGFVNDYESHYWTVDPGRSVVATLRPGSWYFDEQQLGKHAIEHSVFYQEYFRRYGLGTLMCTPVYQDDRYLAGLSFQGGVARKYFGPDDAARLAPLMPHLLQASRLRIQVDSLAKAAALGISMLNSFSFPILAITENSRIVFANAAAEEWLCDKKVLWMSQDAARSTAIRAAIVKIGHRLFHGNTRHAQTQLALPGAASCYLLGLSLPEGHPVGVGFTERVALVIARGATNLAPSATQVFKDLFGLTPAEIRLAEEMQCCDRLSDAADNLAITHGTAKSQLKSIFQKTDCHSQAALRQLWLELTCVFSYEP
jgi:DNA-binding CsgD family transcriptional regulator